MSPIVKLFGICLAFGLVSCKPFTGLTKKTAELMEQYGYLSNGTGGARTLEELTKGIKGLQRFAGIAVTGQLNDETVKLLESDRCGMKDNYTAVLGGSADIGRALIGRYYLQGTYWKKKHLTYKVISYTRDLPRDEQERIFAKSFSLWQAATSLTITDVTYNDPPIKDDSVDILVSFVSRYHKDAYPFDGAGGTLAHAFYPHNNRGLSGDAHFDDDEPFTTGTNSGINLDWVALHEFGHSLGLEHSNVRESVMYPWYKGYKEDIQLTYDDIQGIQALYGGPPRTKTTKPTKPTTEPTKPTTKPTKPTKPTTKPTITQTTKPTTRQPTRTPQVKPDKCRIRSFDTFFDGADDKTYAVSGDYYWIIARPRAGVKSGPHKLTDTFPGLSTPVDAAYTKNGRTVFFRGSRYWQYRYSNQKFIALNIAAPMSQIGLASDLNDMDAAFVYRNNRIYFFKGDQYWRYNEGSRRIDVGYPKTISNGWKGVTGSFTAAMRWGSNGRTYFFTGEDYLRTTKVRHSVDSGYPQNIALKWLKCDPMSLGRISVGGLQIGSLSSGNEDVP